MCAAIDRWRKTLSSSFKDAGSSQVYCFFNESLCFLGGSNAIVNKLLISGQRLSPYPIKSHGVSICVFLPDGRRSVSMASSSLSSSIVLFNRLEFFVGLLCHVLIVFSVPLFIFYFSSFLDRRRDGQFMAMDLLYLHGHHRCLFRDESHSRCPQRVSRRVLLADLISHPMDLPRSNQMEVAMRIPRCSRSISVSLLSLSLRAPCRAECIFREIETESPNTK